MGRDTYSVTNSKNVENKLLYCYITEKVVHDKERRLISTAGQKRAEGLKITSS